MNPVLAVLLSVGGPLAAMGLVKLQARLEQWDQQRHAHD
jgi:hypothetical protein